VLVGEGVPTQLPGFADPRRGAARIGYAPHFYDTAVENGQDWDPADGFVDAYSAAITTYPRAHRMPVLVGEWGPPNSLTPGNSALIGRQLGAMEGFAAGWTMWYWAKGSGGGYAVLGNDGKPLAGDVPVFAPYAAAVAGRPVAESYDPATGRYTLSYATGGQDRPDGFDGHDGLPTRIVLPGTAYPGGVRISVDGGGRRSTVRVQQPRGDRAGVALVSLPPARGGTVTVTVTPG
jgi:endoglycosylceramidase